MKIRERPPKTRTLILLVQAVLLLFFCSGRAEPSSAAAERRGTLELLAGYYQPHEPRYTAVYEQGGRTQGLAFSAMLTRNFDLYMELKGFYKKGELTYSRMETKLLIVPASLGFRFLLPLGMLVPYIGAGADLFFLLETNTIGTVFEYAPGYNIQGGIYLQLGKKSPVWLNMKIKYSRVKKSMDDFTLDLGGMEYTVGLVLVL